MARMREDFPHSPGLKATWKWPIHKALLMRLAQTLYLQNHFSRHSILLPMKVFLSLILPFLKEKKNLFFSGISLYSGTSLYRYPLNMDTHI